MESHHPCFPTAWNGSAVTISHGHLPLSLACTRSARGPSSKDSSAPLPHGTDLTRPAAAKRRGRHLLVDAHGDHGGVGVDVAQGMQGVGVVQLAQPVEQLLGPVPQARFAQVLEQQGGRPGVELVQRLQRLLRDALVAGGALQGRQQ